MKNIVIEKELKSIEKDYNDYFKMQDKQSLFYLIQMTELMYSELSSIVDNKDRLYDLVYNNYKSDISLVFNNMTTYFLKITNNAVSSFNQIITISDGNRYLNLKNISSIYKNFEDEINGNLNIKQKIQVLINSVSNSLLNSLSTLSKDNALIMVVSKYQKLICDELIKNVSSKSNFILFNYNKTIHNILGELQLDKQKIMDMNHKVLMNTTLIYLKEQEIFIIDKYINDNYNYLNSIFDKLEEKLNDKFSAKRNVNIKLNKTKDYLLGFNNTVRIKIQNIFDQMNSVVMTDQTKIRNQVKEYTDLVSNIYEMDLVFDKQFLQYRNEFSVSSKTQAKFNKLFDEETKKITAYLKKNISIIFRENTTIFNSVIYKYLFLLSKIEDYDEVISASKVKDLLSK